MPDKINSSLTNRDAINECVDTILTCQEAIGSINDSLDVVDGDVAIIKADLKEILELIKKKEERDMKKWW
tara:strand:- start:990 stop:1199 length:210 start_codon:yes stop_codon:yes gene_type:complete